MIDAGLPKRMGMGDAARHLKDRAQQILDDEHRNGRRHLTPAEVLVLGVLAQIDTIDEHQAGIVGTLRDVQR